MIHKKRAELEEQSRLSPDRSDAADARRFRWLLEGNGYILEEEYLCGHHPTDESERDKAREAIDLEMDEEEAIIHGTGKNPPLGTIDASSIGMKDLRATSATSEKQADEDEPYHCDEHDWMEW